MAQNPITPRESSEQDSWTIKTPSRLRAEKRSAENKFFGKEMFSPEFLEKAEDITGQYVGSLGENILGGLGNLEEFIRGLTGSKSGTILPTSQDVKKNVTQRFSPILKELQEKGPQSKSAEFAEKAGEISGSLLGLGGVGGGANAAKRTLFTLPFLGAGADRAIKEIGGSEQEAALGSAITLGISSLKNQGGSKKIMQSIYKNAEDAIPRGARVSAKGMENVIESISNKLKHGLQGKGAPSEQTYVQNLMKNMKGLVRPNGEINIKDAWALKIQLGQIIDGLPQELRGVRKYIPALQGSINNVLSQYGRTNPTFLKNLRRGDRIYAGLNNAKGVLRKVYDKSGTTGKYILSGLGIAHPVAAASAFGVGYSARELARILKHPEMARTYLQLIGRASRNDFKGALNSLRKLERSPEVQEMSVDEKNPWKIIPNG